MVDKWSANYLCPFQLQPTQPPMSVPESPVRGKPPTATEWKVEVTLLSLDLIGNWPKMDEKETKG